MPRARDRSQFDSVEHALAETLSLVAWDADHLSGDDKLGAVGVCIVVEAARHSKKNPGRGGDGENFCAAGAHAAALRKPLGLGEICRCLGLGDICRSLGLGEI